MNANIIERTFAPAEIARLTCEIYGQCLAQSRHFKQGNFTLFGLDDLQRLFGLYDEKFFSGWLASALEGRLILRLSQRMTSAAGKVEHHKRLNRYMLSLSTTLMFQSFHEGDREITVNGVKCHDRLEAVQRVLEHEIIHLLELVVYGESSCKQNRFKTLSKNFFNHAEVTHQLVSQRERAFTKFDLRVGDEVEFPFDGQTLRGFIHRITRRATVMVRHPKGVLVDSKGNRYNKYYVPIQILKKIGKQE